MIVQILLAAGLSSRMKRLKPLLEFEGMPLLARLLTECRNSLVDSILVVLGHQEEIIRRAIDFSGVEVVSNPDYRKGQTGSLQAALRKLSPATEAFLNLPVDHPLVTREEIDALVRAYRERRTAEKIFVPTCDGQAGRPVLFDIALRDEILALGHQQPVQGLLRDLAPAVHPVPIRNPHTMKDMDTPEDYQECLRIFRLRQARQPS